MASQDKYVRSTSTTWDSGVQEELTRNELDSQTIDFLGREGYISYTKISTMDPGDVDAFRKKYSLPLAEVSSLKAMIRSMPGKCAGSDDYSHEGKIMTDQQKGTIKKHMYALCHTIKPDLLLIYLHGKGCLTTFDVERCKEQDTSMFRVYEMLKCIQKGSMKDFSELISGLEETGQLHASKLLLDYPFTRHSPECNTDRIGMHISI